MHLRLKRTKKWFEENKKSLALSALIACIALISFALGYITARDLSHPPIVIQKYMSQ